MAPTPEDRRPPLTPQLALRVALIGSFALAMFAIIFFRLWFLQVLSGEKYVAQAATNRLRYIDIPAPRGEILDQSGNVLVNSEEATGVELSPQQLPVPLQGCLGSHGQPLPSMVTDGKWNSACLVAHPPATDAGLYNRLAMVLGKSTKPQKCHVDGYGWVHISPIGCAAAQGYAVLPYANVTVGTDVPYPVLAYLSERQDEFPGVQIQQVWERTYPLHDVAAQLFGTIGPLSCLAIQLHQKPNANNCELKDPHFKNIPHSATVGQSGLEWYYNQYLQGTDGKNEVQVNAEGQAAGSVGEIKPTPGHNLRLSLDVNLQKVGETALAQSIGENAGNGGAFVAMNPQNGEIYAMGSNPSFDPNIFTKPVASSVYAQLNNPASNYPLINRAIQSAGPTGSTFKPITSVAALESGAWNVDDTFDDTGQFCIDGQCRHNAGGAVDGELDLVSALKVSSDDFFYNLGALTNADPQTHPNGGALQHWAHQFGIGRPTGIDLGGELAGNLPTPRWRAGIDAEEAACEKKHHVPSCGIADGRPWSIGDNINLAVGQGDVQVTPLQLAVAYSAIANGGNIVRPHIGLDIEDGGQILQRINPPIQRHLNINPLYLETIRAGLRAAASQPGGTSADVMGNFPEQVYGKTGTAQYNNQNDYSWYSCFVPASATSKPIEVVVWVERGGFGAVAAAPVAREILSQWFFGTPGKYIAGSSQTL
ncbi:MAG TPA: penicillin-binding transpeptidase domain-containing protein [Solirubrobacteraceae bacterium]|nr:penicillin-binding transpeptidase domain-containing protein [Solirubrobacteraceae bacterium]